MSFPVEEKYILATEAKLGVTFPTAFRNKMMRKNGGEVPVAVESDFEDYFELHPFYDTSDKRRLKRTFGSICRETQTHHEAYDLPENLIVIGNNGGGDILVFEIISPDSLRLAWHDHENGDLYPVNIDWTLF